MTTRFTLRSKGLVSDANHAFAAGQLVERTEASCLWLRGAMRFCLLKPITSSEPADYSSQQRRQMRDQRNIGRRHGVIA